MIPLYGTVVNESSTELVALGENVLMYMHMPI